MIGPHQGKELELMLDGKKHLAIFYDAIIEGQTIPETVIPEQAFAPYVASKQIIRLDYISRNSKNPHPTQYVLFILPNHEWRANAFIWMHKECIEGRRSFDDAYEYFVGRLLDYSEEDIADFIQHQKSFRSTVRA